MNLVQGDQRMGLNQKCFDFNFSLTVRMDLGGFQLKQANLWCPLVHIHDAPKVYTCMSNK